MSAADWQRLEAQWLSPKTGVNSTHKVQFSEQELVFLKNKKKLLLYASRSELPFGEINKNGRYIGIGADFIKTLEKQLPIRFFLKKWVVKIHRTRCLNRIIATWVSTSLKRLIKKKS